MAENEFREHFGSTFRGALAGFHFAMTTVAWDRYSIGERNTELWLPLFVSTMCALSFAWVALELAARQKDGEAP